MKSIFQNEKKKLNEASDSFFHLQIDDSKNVWDTFEKAATFLTSVFWNKLMSSTKDHEAKTVVFKGEALARNASMIIEHDWD